MKTARLTLIIAFVIMFGALGAGAQNMLKESMRIFNAYYFPGGNERLYDSITPVNSFRIIFNSYFGADYPLLEDKNYFTNHRHPYNFVDVTDKVKY